MARFDWYLEEFARIALERAALNLTIQQADKKYAELMTKMEKEFSISQIPKLNANIDPEVMELYRSISDARVMGDGKDGFI